MRLFLSCLFSVFFTFSSAISEESASVDSMRSYVLEKLDAHYGGITLDGLLRQAISLPESLFVHREVYFRDDLISDLNVVYQTQFGSLLYLQYREQETSKSTLRRVELYVLREWGPYHRALIGQASPADSAHVSAENYTDVDADGRVDIFISPYVPRSSSSGPVEVISSTSLSERESVIQNNYTLYLNDFRDFVVDSIASLLKSEK